ncbi:hypothetical protein [Streptomyces sp. BRA346]|uniref:hypothetical protein n=1 Tax=Streptomyces sp. BRA346 TaxID=2878199 RepID=UPI00406407BC
MELMEIIGSTDIAQYRDEYRAAVEAVISAKLDGREPPRWRRQPSQPEGWWI